MITKPAVPEASVVPTEVSDSIGKLQGEVEKLKMELAQALEVWQTTLASERVQFGELLKHKESAWLEQENQWAMQSQTYEQRLEALKTDFESRLKQTEQNAAQALAQLDDDWQRDKLEWGARDQWPVERGVLQEKIASLETELAEKKSSASPSPDIVKTLQGQLLEFQQTVASFQDRAARSDELVNACVQALDYQISVLYDLVQHFAVPTPSSEPPLDLV
jgi:chromosome segregation ATPase